MIKYGKGARRMKKWFYIVLGCLLLVGCTADKSPSKESPKTEQPSVETTKMADYYPLENKIYSYKGEGNEYATYKETFYEKEGDYLPSIVDNGGTCVLKVYQFTADGIYLVYEQAEFYDETLPALDSIKSEFKPIPLLVNPLEVGTVFEEWKIVDKIAKLTLPIGEVHDVLVIEKKGGDKSIVKNYWAAGYGKVMDEFLYTDESGEEFVVTSKLEKIN